MRDYLKYLFNSFYLFLKDNKYENFLYFSYKLQEKFPKGSWLVYHEIAFYVKDFTSHPNKRQCRLKYNQDKLYIVTEYYDDEKKVWREKIFHEDFLKTRYLIFLKTGNNDQ